jgi:endonuclease/exonuclease/phosphatase family metal-dependent hydrolase
VEEYVGGRRGRRRVDTVPAMRLLLWLAVTPLAGLAVVVLAGLDHRFPLTELVAYTPYAVSVAVGVAVVALGLRRFPAGVLALAAAAVLAAQVAPRVFADDAGAPAGGVRLRVLTVNLRLGTGDPATVVDLVRSHHVDLLALQEFTPEAYTALAGQLHTMLPDAVADPMGGASGSAIFTRYPVRDDSAGDAPAVFTQARAEVTVPGARTLAVRAVHVCSPAAGRRADGCWAPEIDAQPRPGDARTHVLLGDFNATLDHSPVRQLLAAGYRDAADVCGAGLTGTWPYNRNPLPPITIDHVLAERGTGITGYAVYPVPGSDHRAVYAELVLPPA